MYSAKASKLIQHLDALKSYQLQLNVVTFTKMYVVTKSGFQHFSHIKDSQDHVHSLNSYFSYQVMCFVISI